MPIGSRSVTGGSRFTRFWTYPTSLYARYDELLADLQRLQRDHSHLMRLEDIGDAASKCDGRSQREIWLVRVTSPRQHAGPKRKVLCVAGMHGDEVVNPDLMLRWLVDSLPRYGLDPEVTALLDTCELLIVPMANPDGREKVRRGNDNGLDLNRNFDVGYQRSKRPREQPESAALSALILRERPDLFVDWHSCGRMFVLPWGHTRERPPHAGELEAISKKLGTLNGYRSVWGSDLYSRPHAGTAHDFAYRLGIPSLTVETCTAKSVSARQFEQAWAENKGVMTYLGRIADAPFERVAGPDVVNIRVKGARLLATISEETSGRDRIVAAEYVLDPSTPPGQGTRMEPVDGSFDSALEEVRAELRVTPDPQRRRLLYVRGQDEHGNWGPLSPAWSV